MRKRETPVIVSACLLGLACRYDGQAKPSQAAMEALEGRVALPVCPETAAGLGVPRPSIDFVDEGGGALVARTRRGLPNTLGVDVADRLVDACERLAAVARAAGAQEAILKARSPSCGVHQIYVRGTLAAGEGVLTALLRRQGVTVRSEEDLP